MPRVFASVDEALEHLSGELVDLNAEALAAQALAITAFKAAIVVRDLNALCAEARTQIEHVTFTAGDADLNASVKMRALAKLEVLLQQFQRPMA